MGSTAGAGGKESFIFRSYHRYGHEVPKLLGLVSPQSELQEVLGTDEEAGPLDDAETASIDGPEEKEQENIDSPVQTALLTASVKASGEGAWETSWRAGMEFHLVWNAQLLAYMFHQHLWLLGILKKRQRGGRWGIQ